MQEYIPIINQSPELAECRDQWVYDEEFGVWCLEDIFYTMNATTPKFQRMSIFVPKNYLNADGTVNEAGQEGRYTAKTAPVVFENNSAGWSAGGAMSSLVGITGNPPDYEPFLRENGAFMEEKDDVFAAQIYCPIIDLDHAVIAYEWQFHEDEENEASPAGPAGRMTTFLKALSAELKADYIEYFNSLGLTDAGGNALTLGADGRSGSGYDYLMRCLEASASDYLGRLDRGELADPWTSADYLSGNYVHEIDAPPGGGPDDKDDLGLHHAGAAVMVPPAGDDPGKSAAPPHGTTPAPGKTEPPSLGDLVSRPPKGVPYVGLEFPKIEVPGTDKRGWLRWDGVHASITSLDDYLLSHRRRMKPCTSFDTLGNDSGENQEFGTKDQDYMHFDPYIAPALDRLRKDFPEEVAELEGGFTPVPGDADLAERRRLINPLGFIGDPACVPAGQYRIRVGAQDADTAFTMSMTLALMLGMQGHGVDYALVWDQPHCEADYPGEVCDWIEAIV